MASVAPFWDALYAAGADVVLDSLLEFTDWFRSGRSPAA